ncbi:alginate lyase family protein [Kaistia dalseonensis]|uniref:Poly(Beta-D-mannuronate) lyase n=1 Tax=Kaistia dalseonensis TaxID=410840 RepID=A0ABU0H3G1_9HYPH|nr:alginate lyase family protein [Kaistia dalseonensis]MCX5493766.1 alginate lyase family protein [Kaistia dalseonensis]MDQ0436330.1 poly(beta-D-mannuronate) lyase [Kaistia dalseonensis]
MVGRRCFGRLGALALYALLAIPVAQAATSKPNSADCPSLIPPMVDVSHLASFYANTSSQSTIDPDKYDLYIKRTRDFDDLLKFVVQFGAVASAANGSASAPPPSTSCLLRQLDGWARTNALTRGIKRNDDVGQRQAAMLQAWAVVAITSALRQTPDIDTASEQYRDVIQWLKKLAWSIHSEFLRSPKKPAWKKQVANHSHWAGLAQARVGVLTGDSRLLQAGMKELDRALDAVDDDGALPREMARGERALHYMNFAVLPIAGLVSIANETGYELSDAQMDDLLRLVRFTLDANTDPAAFEAKMAQKQLMQGVRDELVWIDVILPTIEVNDPELAIKMRQYARTVGPLQTRFYGPVPAAPVSTP